MSKRFRCRCVGLVLFASLVMLAACQAPQPTPVPPTQVPTSAPPTQAATVAPATKAAAAVPATQAPVSASPTTQAVAPTKPATLQKIRLSYSALTASQSLMWVAKEKGLFEKYGLDAEVTNIATVQQIAALNAGQVDIGQTSADNVASAVLNGADLKEVALFLPYIEAYFFGRPEIKTAADLKGKTVGVPTAGPGIQRHATEYALQKLGLTPDKDVTIRVFNTTKDAFAAAKSGIIQGIALFPPDPLEAQKAGFNLLYDVDKDRVLYPSSSVYTSNKFIRDHPDMVLAFIKAVSEALQVYKTDPDFTINTFLKWTKTDDRAVAKAGLDVLRGDLPDIPKWSPEPMKMTLQTLSGQIDKAKTTDPASLYDNSFVEQLEKEGFYAQLLKQYAGK